MSKKESRWVPCRQLRNIAAVAFLLINNGQNIKTELTLLVCIEFLLLQKKTEHENSNTIIEQRTR